MSGIQESLVGRVAVLSLTSLSQAEIYGSSMKPFEIDMEALLERKEDREQEDVGDIFQRIYKGTIPAIIMQAVVFFCMYRRESRGFSS